MNPSFGRAGRAERKREREREGERARTLDALSPLFYEHRALRNDSSRALQFTRLL